MRLLIFCVFLVGGLFFHPQASVFAASPAATNDPKAFEYDINLRPVYYYVHTTNRDGSENTEKTINLRARLGLSYHVSDKLTFRVRFVTRLSDNQDDFRFILDDHTSGSGSYPAGIATIDEFLLKWKINPKLSLTAGRFQGRFPLAGFIPKGVDRYYASNVSVSHTDGLWLEWDVSDHWRLNLIGSHNSTKGSTHAARSPLRFDESPTARVTGYANIQHKNTRERWAQREFSVSMTPKNFYRDGELKNHVAFSTRWMYRPDFSISGEEYLVGGELGFIPVAPRPSDAGLQIPEEKLMFGKSAVSWMVSAYANNVFKRHRIGILYGQVDPHWLISSSIAPNATMAELRYRYTIASWINYEFRFRLRDEIFKPTNALQTREIFDFYTRVTISF